MHGRPPDGSTSLAEEAGNAGNATRALVLTTFDLDEYVYEALRAGASGFLLKEVTAEELFHAVRVVAAGDALLDPSVTRRLIAEFARLRPHPGLRSPNLAALTKRETEVLQLVAEGLSNREIAERLVLSEETVKSHVSRMLTKLDLRDRAQAVVVAYESGLVAADSHAHRPSALAAIASPCRTARPPHHGAPRRTNSVRPMPAMSPPPGTEDRAFGAAGKKRCAIGPAADQVDLATGDQSLP